MGVICRVDMKLVQNPWCCSTKLSGLGRDQVAWWQGLSPCLLAVPPKRAALAQCLFILKLFFVVSTCSLLKSLLACVPTSWSSIGPPRRGTQKKMEKKVRNWIPFSKWPMQRPHSPNSLRGRRSHTFSTRSLELLVLDCSKEDLGRLVKQLMQRHAIHESSDKLRWPAKLDTGMF